MLILALAAGYSVTAASLAAQAHHHHHHHHRARCSGEVREGFCFRSFELCVANREAGEPGSRHFRDINWRYSGDYEGAYNWVHSTWLSMGGGRYAYHAYDATPREQTLIFRAHANSHDWPNTVPACL